ncbi:MAG: restriction endonuclease subunit S [Bacteroidaceae bacterium]|nr:restriction endonuclease subunit S [Bacteroidaceae bacterium]
MSEWRKIAIGELVTLRQGFAINVKSKHYISKEQTSLALLRIADMKSGSREIFVKEDIPQNFIAKPQDIIYTRTGNVGLVFRNNYGVVHNNCFTVTPNDECILSRDFLYYLLQSHYFFEKANSLARGAAQPDLPHTLFNSIEISYPNLDTQQRITTILSRYDSLIENYQKQIKLLEESAQRLYKEWFIDLRFPGHENTKIVDGVPEGWEKKKVGDVTPIKTGKKDANFGTNDGPFPFFTCAQEPIKAPSYSFDTNAVILAGNGDFNVKLYRGKFEAYQRTYVLEPINDKMLYLLYFCIAENMKRLAIEASGSTIKFLTKGMIENLVINEPSTIVLDSFNQIIESIRTQKEKLISQILHLTEARDRLLPKLMSGEIGV